jgi:hypothetical protein
MSRREDYVRTVSGVLERVEIITFQSDLQDVHPPTDEVLAIGIRDLPMGPRVVHIEGRCRGNEGAEGRQVVFNHGATGFRQIVTMSPPGIEPGFKV